MATYITSPLSRGQSGQGAFPTSYEADLQVSRITVANITARNNLEAWKRTSKMEVKVIDASPEAVGTAIFELQSDLTTWVDITQTVPANIVTEDDIFNENGYIKSDLLQNLFINDSYIVADETERLALTTVLGNVVFQLDDGTVWIKLNNDDPADAADFADITANTGAVLTVNGQTGNVTISIESLLEVTANVTAFNNQVASSPSVSSNTSAISIIQDNIVSLTASINNIIGEAGNKVLDWNESDSFALGNLILFEKTNTTKELYKVTQTTTAGQSPENTTNNEYFEKIGDYYTKEEIDNALALKADLIDGKIPIGQIPTALLGMQIVADIDARNNLDLYEGLRVIVIDASADPNISNGAAEYVLDSDYPTADAQGFVLIPGSNGVDLSFSQENVIRYGGVGGTPTESALTAFARTLLAGANEAAVRAILGYLAADNITNQVATTGNMFIRNEGATPSNYTELGFYTSGNFNIISRDAAARVVNLIASAANASMILSGSNALSHTAGIEVSEANGVGMFYRRAIGGSLATVDVRKLYFDKTNSRLVYDSTNGGGAGQAEWISYAGDYAANSIANIGDRAIPDVGWVLAQIAALLTNVITTTAGTQTFEGNKTLRLGNTDIDFITTGETLRVRNSGNGAYFAVTNTGVQMGYDDNAYLFIGAGGDVVIGGGTNLSLGGFGRIINLVNPIGAQDATTKSWVEAQIAAVSSTSSAGIHPPVQNITALQALDTTDIADYPDKWLINVEDAGLYRFDRDSSATEDSPRTIAPTTGVGRWFKMNSTLSSHNLLEQIQGGTTNEYYHLTAAQHAIVVATQQAFTTALMSKLEGLDDRGSALVNYNSVSDLNFTTGRMIVTEPLTADRTITSISNADVYIRDIYILVPASQYTLTINPALAEYVIGQPVTGQDYLIKVNFYQNSGDKYVVEYKAVNQDIGITALSSTSNACTIDFENRNTFRKFSLTLNENTTISFSNAANRDGYKIYLNITGATRTITLPTSVLAVTSAVAAITGASWDGDDLILPVGKYEIGFDFDGTNDYMKVSGAYE